jgi:hypothetical protein
MHSKMELSPIAKFVPNPNTISRTNMLFGEPSPSGDQHLEEAIRRLESHSRSLQAQLWLRKVVEYFERRASPKSRVYGSKACLKRVLHLVNAWGSAFLPLVTDKATQRDFITLLRYVESVAWNEYLGPAPSAIHPASDTPENQSSPIHVRIEEWITASFQFLVRLEEAPAEVGLYEAVVIKGTERRAAVDGYIAEVFRRDGRVITRKDIWTAAGYKTRSAFERWERNDPKHPSKLAYRRFTQILASKPHLKKN